MGPRGPLPFPTEVKRRRGNPGRKPLPENEPVPRRAARHAPDWLDDEAKKEWRRIAPELFRLKLLTVADWVSLGAYCDCVSRMKKALKEIEADGLTCVTPNGALQQHPAVSIVNQCQEKIQRWAQHFGFSPAARARLVGAPSKGKDEDPFGEFLNGRPRHQSG